MPCPTQNLKKLHGLGSAATDGLLERFDLIPFTMPPVVSLGACPVRPQRGRSAVNLTKLGSRRRYASACVDAPHAGDRRRQQERQKAEAAVVDAIRLNEVIACVKISCACRIAPSLCHVVALSFPPPSFSSSSRPPARMRRHLEMRSQQGSAPFLRPRETKYVLSEDQETIVLPSGETITTSALDAVSAPLPPVFALPASACPEAELRLSRGISRDSCPHSGVHHTAGTECPGVPSRASALAKTDRPLSRSCSTSASSPASVLTSRSCRTVICWRIRLGGPS